MKTVAGVFRSRVHAERAVAALQSAGVSSEEVLMLTPGDIRQEQPASPAPEVPLIAAVVPGLGMISAIGRLGGAMLSAAGAPREALDETQVESAVPEGLPEDEIFVYEDVLRNGDSIVIVMAEENTAERLLEQLNTNGAGSIDEARGHWWTRLRSAEQKDYTTLNRNFTDDEKFYRLGFEAALHARTRCKEYDQVLGEMTARLEELQHQYPDSNVEKPFIRGYERGRDYYQRLCDQSRAA